MYHIRNIVYLGAHHILALYAFSQIGWLQFAEVILLAQIAGLLGITAGAHRLWSHKSYKASATARTLMMLANCAAHQGSIYHWVRDHRMHHKYSDTLDDPHSIRRGFWYAHVGWLLVTKSPAAREKMLAIPMDDIRADRIVMFQHRYYLLLSHLFCFVLPALYGRLLHGSAWEGYLFYGVLRWILLLHATWCVNSVAHLWGYRPYRPAINPTESWPTAILAVGEGWHNFHHAYPFDCRASEFGRWNPTTSFIYWLQSMGHAWDLKTYTPGSRAK